MRRPPLVALLTLAVTAVTPAPAAAFDLERLPGTYGTTVHVAGPPGDPSQLFALGKGGRIFRYQEGAAEPTIVKDLAGRVETDSEKGLLSIAFAPDYASSGRYWLFLNVDAPGQPGSDIVVEEHLRDDPEHAAEIIRIPHHEYGNHNGGQLQVGPDGHLWIGTGDGGGQFDPLGNAQDPRSLLGKLLRIAPKPGGGYTIPPDNPFADGAAGAPEVWATGLRNPWRFGFDRETGDLMIGDVGQGDIEEIDRASAPDRGRGSNYGWVAFEGSLRTRHGTAPANHHRPLIEHTHDDGWFSITGGVVIRDPGLCERGRYVYGDFVKGELWLADPATGATAASDERIESLTTFGEDAAGRVYAASIDGAVYRLVPDGTLCPASSGGGQPPAPGGDQTGGGGAPATDVPGGIPGAARSSLLPSLVVGTARRPRARRRGRVFLRAACRSACTLRATGGLWVGRRRFALRSAPVTLRSAGTRTLILRLGPKARRALRRALRRGAHPRALLSVRASGLDAGASERRRLTIAIVR